LGGEGWEWTLCEEARLTSRPISSHCFTLSTNTRCDVSSSTSKWSSSPSTTLTSHPRKRSKYSKVFLVACTGITVLEHHHLCVPAILWRSGICVQNWNPACKCSAMLMTYTEAISRFTVHTAPVFSHQDLVHSTSCCTRLIDNPDRPQFSVRVISSR
jgi:hypothetical protein